jgi:hypothetical protein
MQCSQKTAQRRAKEIREHYGIKYITVFHLAEYLGVSTTHLASYWAYVSNKPNAENLIFPHLKTKKDKSDQ